MGTRLDLQALLETFGEGISVYFQPPSNVEMTYPAIVYNRDLLSTDFADNAPYANMFRYQITVIDPDPDSLIHEKVSALPLMRYVRHYTTEGLNHDIYNVYF